MRQVSKLCQNPECAKEFISTNSSKKYCCNNCIQDHRKQQVNIKVCEKCGNRFPNRLEVDGKIRNLQRRRYCLKCSPFGSHNTKDLMNNSNSKTHKTCPDCKTEKHYSEYYRRRKTQTSTYCKLCTNKRTVIRQKRNKDKVLEFMGGSCAECGYSKYRGALSLHHKDPTEKDQTLDAFSKRSLEKLKPELEKCVLLCVNCHREAHYQPKDSCKKRCFTMEIAKESMCRIQGREVLQM